MASYQSVSMRIFTLWTLLLIFTSSEAAMCGELPDVANAEAALQGLHPPFPPGTNISYSCHNGYISNISGTTYATCVADNETAEWSFEPFYCKSTCTTLPEVPHAELELGDRTPPFPSETTITFVCDPGYVTDLRVLQVTCREVRNGSAFWDQPSNACKPRSCGFPGDIENSRRIGSVFSYPNNVTYVCNEGFRLRGIGTIYCMTTGVWRPDPPSCEAVICPLLPDPEHGKVISYERRFGSTAAYECDRGYRLEGSTRRYCQADGMWSNSMPSCTEITCPHPGLLINGRIINDRDVFKSGELIIFVCNDGQRVSSKCLETGVWHKRPPLCRAPSNNTTTLKVPTTAMEVTQTPVDTKAFPSNTSTPVPTTAKEDIQTPIDIKGSVTCEDPGNIPHGQRTITGFRSGNYVTYSCEEGYELRGNGTFICLETGKWNLEKFPICIKPLPVIVIVGVIIAIIIIVALGVGGLFFYRWRKKKRCFGKKSKALTSDATDFEEIRGLEKDKKPIPVTVL